MLVAYGSLTSIPGGESRATCSNWLNFVIWSSTRNFSVYPEGIGN